MYGTRVDDTGLSLACAQLRVLARVGVSSFISARLVKEMQRKRIQVEGFSEDRVMREQGAEETDWWTSLFSCVAA